MTINLDFRLESLAHTGRSARAVGAILRAEGHKISDSTVGRRMGVLLGPQRSTTRARPPSPPKASVAPSPPRDLVVTILADWVRAQPDPEAAGAAVHASLEGHFRRGEAMRAAASSVQP